MTGAQCALYARVSSESQARDNTIASQVTALRERIAADGFQLEPDHNYVDEGYSGAILFRPALERLRDAVAGSVDPDRPMQICVERCVPPIPPPRNAPLRRPDSGSRSDTRREPLSVH